MVLHFSRLAYGPLKSFADRQLCVTSAKSNDRCHNIVPRPRTHHAGIDVLGSLHPAWHTECAIPLSLDLDEMICKTYLLQKHVVLLNDVRIIVALTLQHQLPSCRHLRPPEEARREASELS
jgi:hypothetical protein